MNHAFACIALVLLAATMTARADVLTLKTGKTYSGTITRTAPGKVSVATAQGTLAFNDDQVNFAKCTYAAPANQDTVDDLLKNKQYAKALPLIEAWEKRYRDLPSPWYEKAIYGMATCLSRTGKPVEAEKNYKLLLEKFPESQFRTDAESWLIDNDINKAGASGADMEKKLIELLNDRRSSDSVRARVHSLLGKNCESQKNWKEALDNYVTIIVLYGDIEEYQQLAQRKCADMFAKCGRTNEAAFYYQQTLETYGKDLSPEDKALCQQWAKLAAVPAPQPKKAAAVAPKPQAKPQK